MPSCHEATHGNPFYLRELATALRPRANARVSTWPGAYGHSESPRSPPMSCFAWRGWAATASAWRKRWRSWDRARRYATPRPWPHWTAERAGSAADAMRAADLTVGSGHPVVRSSDRQRDDRLPAAGGAARRSARRGGAAARGGRRSGGQSGRPPAFRRTVRRALGRGGAARRGRDALARGAPEAASSYLRRALAEPPRSMIA